MPLLNEVTPNFKPSGSCGCGCGKEGTYRVRAWSSGVLCVRNCNSCKSCKAKISSGRGYRDQQTKGAKEVFGRRGRRHEQNDRAALRWENKTGTEARLINNAWDRIDDEDAIVELLHPDPPHSLIMFRGDHLPEAWHTLDDPSVVLQQIVQKSIVNPVFNIWRRLEKDDEFMRPISDNRPFLCRFSLPGRRFSLFVFRSDQLDNMHHAFALEHGFKSKLR
jgi:hypothetical protein